jgi:hypothetical protein
VLLLWRGGRLARRGGGTLARRRGVLMLYIVSCLFLVAATLEMYGLALSRAGHMARGQLHGCLSDNAGLWLCS